MSSRALIARVVPDVTGLDKHFDYLVPEAMRAAVRVGSIVRVPLGPRRVRGWVVHLEERASVEGLKPVAAVVGLGPAPELVELAAWASHRWCGPLRAVLNSASPSTVVPAAVRRPSTQRSHVDETGRQHIPPSGVHRLPPCSDPVDLVLAAAAAGPLLVCCPSTAEAARLAARLRRTGLRTALMPREWAVAAGGVDVVIGSRGAVWAPCPSLAGVLVLDEHDETLQEERSPTWHARDVAIERAARAGAQCWLVSPAPSLEALQWGSGTMHRPSRDEERAGWPFVQIVDLDAQDLPVPTLVTRELLELSRAVDGAVVAVLNTKGRARRLVCKACSHRIRCAGCGAAASLGSDGFVQCARCSQQRPGVCDSCGSTRLAPVGLGISRLRDDLASATQRQVVEVAASTADEVVSGASDRALFIGTEAVLHRVRRAGVVVFLDFDDELLAPRFRAAEEAMALIVHAARLVGPRGAGGRIVVQTRVPGHEVLLAALHADPSRLVADELARRESLRMPPAWSIAQVRGDGAGAWLDSVLVGDVSGGGETGWLVRERTPELLADTLAALGPRPSGVRVGVDPHRI